MILYKKDLKFIGYKTLEDKDKNMVFVSKETVANVERILLRNILLLFGDYKIVRESGTFDGDSIFYTNFPLVKYVNL